MTNELAKYLYEIGQLKISLEKQESLARRAQLLATTPAPFKMRNIFGGDRMFLNKGELVQLRG